MWLHLRRLNYTRISKIAPCPLPEQARNISLIISILKVEIQFYMRRNKFFPTNLSLFHQEIGNNLFLYPIKITPKRINRDDSIGCTCF